MKPGNVKIIESPTFKPIDAKKSNLIEVASPAIEFDGNERAREL